MFIRFGQGLLIGIVVLALSLTALNYLGVLLDEEPLKYDGLVAIAEVSPEDNGFDVLKDRLADDNYEDPDELNELVVGAWDKGRAMGLLTKHDDRLGLMKAVLKKPAFKSYPVDFNSALPRYDRYKDILYIALLGSRHAAESKDYEAAIEYINLAFRFSEKLKTDQSATLIAYLIGMVYQQEVVNWTHRFASNYLLSEKELALLTDILQSLPSYSEDGYDKLMSGEFTYATSMPNEVMNPSFIERIGLIFDAFSDSYQAYDSTWGDSWLTKLLSIPSYNFFYQKNRARNSMIRGLVYLQQAAAAKYCAEIDFDHISVTERGLLSSLGMGSLGNFEVAQWAIYTNRRCLSNFHSQAVKVSIALKRYELVNSEKATSLIELVPDYLDSVPIDAFTGEPILYNSNAQTIYSRGVNAKDGGGEEVNFKLSCHQECECKNNPTVLVRVDIDHRLNN